MAVIPELAGIVAMFAAAFAAAAMRRTDPKPGPGYPLPRPVRKTR